MAIEDLRATIPDAAIQAHLDRLHAVQDPGWTVDLFVPGLPAPQGSKHARPIYKGRGAEKEFTGHVAQVESSKSKVADWREDVRKALAGVWQQRPPIVGAVVLRLSFLMPRPLSTPKRSTPPATKRPDVSKLIRSTEDAITSSGVWRDDSLVVELHSTKRLCELDEAPGCRIQIGAL